MTGRVRTKIAVVEARQLLRSLLSGTFRVASAHTITKYVAGIVGTRTTRFAVPRERLPARRAGTARLPAKESFALLIRSREK